jgi:hypothetical protein
VSAHFLAAVVGTVKWAAEGVCRGLGDLPFAVCVAPWSSGAVQSFDEITVSRSAT